MKRRGNFDFTGGREDGSSSDDSAQQRPAARRRGPEGTALPQDLDSPELNLGEGFAMPQNAVAAPLPPPPNRFNFGEDVVDPLAAAADNRRFEVAEAVDSDGEDAVVEGVEDAPPMELPPHAIPTVSLDESRLSNGGPQTYSSENRPFGAVAFPSPPLMNLTNVLGASGVQPSAAKVPTPNVSPKSPTKSGEFGGGRSSGSRGGGGKG